MVYFKVWLLLSLNFVLKIPPKADNIVNFVLEDLHNNQVYVNFSYRPPTGIVSNAFGRFS